MPISNSLASIIPVIFAQGLTALRGKCVMPSLCNVSYAPLAAEKGQIITIPIPSAITTADVAPAAYAPDTGNLAPTVAQITLNNWREAAFTLTENEISQAANGYPAKQATAAISALADYVNSTIFAKYKKFYAAVGSAGSAPFASTVNAAVDAKELLTTMKAPSNDRRMVLDTTAMGNALKLGAFAYILNSNDPGVMKEGEIGRKYGFDWFEDQQVPYHTSTALTAGACTVNGAHSAGVTTVSIAKATNTSPLVAGDIITFANDTQQYVVTADVTLAVGNTNVTISPGLAAAKSGSEAVTLVASHRVNLAFQADAFGFVSRTLAHVAGAEPNPYSMELADPISGLTLRLQVREEFHRIRWAFDMLWGVDVVRPELGCRVLG
jgi:hypothetical protein